MLRTDVQGAADLMMGLTAASAGGVAGLVVGSFGYPALALSSVVLAVAVVVAAASVGRDRQGRGSVLSKE